MRLVSSILLGMTRELLDFYAGFEGEPELLFFLDGCLRLRCWEGYVDTLFDAVAPQHGQTGLAEAYHLDAWGDEPWHVTDNVACLAQLRDVRERTDLAPKPVSQMERLRLALIGLFEEAVSTSARVTVQRD